MKKQTNTPHKETLIAGVFAVTYGGLETIFHLLIMVHSLEYLKEKLSFLGDVDGWIFQSIVFVIAILFSWAVVNLYIKYQLRNPPELKNIRHSKNLNKYANDSNLEFRYNQNIDCIINTAKLEEYGERGETDVEQVFNWWLLYRGAAIVMTYKEKIIGGIDLYPVKQDIYEKLANGELQEEDLTNPNEQFDPYMIGRVDEIPKNGTFWYIAGISLGGVFRKKRDRLELLIRLFVNTAEKWLEPKPPSPEHSTKLRKPIFPAHLVAITWTKEGTNLLAGGLGFTYRCKDESGDDVYEKIFETEKEVEAFIQQYKIKLQN